MLADWTTYAVEDFIPFTPEVYFRLLERANQQQWPLHFLFLTLGAAASLLLLPRRGRLAAPLLASAWAWTAHMFLMRHYADLSPAGPAFAWTFHLQALLLLAFGLSGQLNAHPRPAITRWLGLTLLLTGLAAYPLLAPLTGHGWTQSETFAIHPDPTALATLGFLLLAARGWTLCLLALLPLLWCILSGLTLHTLDAPWAFALPAAATLTLAAIIHSSLSRAPSSRQG